jgi:hypothetical protein
MRSVNPESVEPDNRTIQFWPQIFPNCFPAALNKISVPTLKSLKKTKTNKSQTKLSIQILQNNERLL